MFLLDFLFRLQLRFKRDVNIWHSYGEAIQKFSSVCFASAFGLAYAVWWVFTVFVWDCQMLCGENWDLTIWKMTVVKTDYCVHSDWIYYSCTTKRISLETSFTNMVWARRWQISEDLFSNPLLFHWIMSKMLINKFSLLFCRVFLGFI